jgi:putative membrane protein
LIIAILTGFLIGSLNKIWPWKETLETSTNKHGEIIPLVQQNIMPSRFTAISQESNHLIMAVVLMITGITIIIILDRFGSKKNKKSDD